MIIVNYENFRRDNVLQTKYILIFFVLLIILYTHYRRFQSAGSFSAYIREILGNTDYDGRRIKSFDYIRALAVIFVIAAHVVQSDGSPAEGSGSRFALQILAVLFLNCNLLFVMLSGALILNQKEEPVSVFYRKRVFKVVIPMAVYYLFYLYMGLYQSGLTDPKNLLDACRRFLSGPSEWNPHFWLMYVILSFYLAAPFFKVMVQNMSDRLLLSFVALTFLMNGALSWLPFLGIEFHFVTILCGWESVFVFGYFWTRPFSNRYRKPFMVLGAASFFITAVISCVRPDYADAFLNKAPTMLLMSGAVFAWFTGREDKFNVPDKAVRIIGKYGFSILLIHWYILHHIAEDRLGLFASSWGLLGGTVATVAVTLILSLLFSVIFDHTAVLCVNTVCDAALQGTGWLKKKIPKKAGKNT